MRCGGHHKTSKSNEAALQKLLLKKCSDERTPRHVIARMRESQYHANRQTLHLRLDVVSPAQGVDPRHEFATEVPDIDARLLRFMDANRLQSRRKGMRFAFVGRVVPDLGHDCGKDPAASQQCGNRGTGAERLAQAREIWPNIQRALDASFSIAKSSKDLIENQQGPFTAAESGDVLKEVRVRIGDRSLSAAYPGSGLQNNRCDLSGITPEEVDEILDIAWSKRYGALVIGVIPSCQPW